MKLQYLGDAKDSFKWDYHDYLMSELGYSLFNIALMMTPDDGGGDGKLKASLFPARKEVISFCNRLKQNRSLRYVKNLPNKTAASYKVVFHKGCTKFTNKNRPEYFSGFNNKEKQIIFLDPDNGFEPKRACNEKHVKFSDITSILDQVSNESIISVFQHHRRIKFKDDYAGIKKRIESGYSTAIYWHSLMFVLISKSKKALNRVTSVNKKYAKNKPVEVIY